MAPGLALSARWTERSVRSFENANPLAAIKTALQEPAATSLLDVFDIR